MKDNTLDKLYEFIARLVVTLEDELDELSTRKCKSAIVLKKNITDMLGKLVSLIIQLNKLSKEESANSVIDVSGDDQKIIEQFLEKYKTTLL